MALYQDPMQIQPVVVPPALPSMDLIPKEFSLHDPIMLRHTLCLVSVIHNCFHAYLCWRQLRLCSQSVEPPAHMQGIMSQGTFDSSKEKEMHQVELKFMRYIIDAIFSCLELYLGVFPYLWKITMVWFHDIGDEVWHNMVFMVLFSTYMVIRTLPSIVYDKVILDQFYKADLREVQPLVGLICALAFLIVLMQVALIPLTAIFVFIEKNGGKYFVLWIWGFIFVVSVVSLLFFNMVGTPCLGKSIKLTEGTLYNELIQVLSDFDFPTHRVYVMETFHIANATAYVWGCCCCKRLVILDNLIYNRGKTLEELHEDEMGLGLKEDQLPAFVAHQLSHWHNHHFLKSFGMWQVSLLIYLMLFGSCYHLPTLYQAAGFSNKLYPHIVGYWLVYKYVMPPYLTITNWIIFYFMRHFEYTADAYTRNLGYGSNLKSALLKLFSDNYMFPLVDPWYLNWHRKRPSILHRLKNL